MNFSGDTCVSVVSEGLSRYVANPFQLLLGGQQMGIGFSPRRAVLPGKKNQVDQRFERIVDFMSDRRSHTACGREFFGLDHQAFHPSPVRNVAGNL